MTQDTCRIGDFNTATSGGSDDCGCDCGVGHGCSKARTSVVFTTDSTGGYTMFAGGGSLDGVE